MNYHEPLQPNTFNHIFSRAVGDEKLFKSEENYRYFLSKFKSYISTVANTYAYCLLPNHFHVLVKTKEELDVFAHLQATNKLERSYSKYCMQAFSNFLNFIPNRSIKLSTGKVPYL